MPEYASILSQMLAAFRKKNKLASISLPNLNTLYQILTSQVVILEILVALWAYWTGLILCLRSKEIFLIKREFFHVSAAFPGCYELRWPKEMIGNGVKAGPVRVIHPFQLPMMDLFCKFAINPFVFLARGDKLNKLLDRLLGVTGRSMRHCGAYLVLNDQKALSGVANALGHSSLLCAAYYLDPWYPLVDHSTISNALIIKLKEAKILTPA